MNVKFEVTAIVHSASERKMSQFHCRKNVLSRSQFKSLYFATKMSYFREYDSQVGWKDDKIATEGLHSWA